MLRYTQINEHAANQDNNNDGASVTTTTSHIPSIRILQPNENQNLICFQTTGTTATTATPQNSQTKETPTDDKIPKLLCGYNCFISEESEPSSSRADILISNICQDNLQLGGAYLNVITKPNSRYLMACPYGTSTSILDVVGEMYVNRENFVACHLIPTVVVAKAYNVTTRNSDFFKMTMNKDRWLRIGRMERRHSFRSTSLRTSRNSRSTQKRRHSVDGQKPYQVAIGGHSQLSIVELLHNTIQTDNDNVVAVIGNINNIDIDVIHSAQKKHSTTGTTTGRAFTGERTGEDLHFCIKNNNEKSRTPIYVVLQGSVYGRKEVIDDIKQYAPPPK